jgi:CHASE3 domain sensor protein
MLSQGGLPTNACLMRPFLLTPMRLLSAIVALAILSMFAVAVVTDHLADVSLSASQSSRVHLISEVTQALKQAQDCRASYLATGNPAYLDAYRAACSDVDSSMDRLVKRDNDVASKLAHAQGLREFVHARLSEIERELESKPIAKPPGIVPAADGDLARIQRLLDSLGQDESRDMSGQLEAAHVRTVFHRNLVIALAIINILFLGGVAFCAIQIGKLYSLVTMCAWSRRVQYRDRWVPLEEYLRKRFGIRISHGISQEEYEKWAESELTGETPSQEEPPAPAAPPKSVQTPKAAA